MNKWAVVTGATKGIGKAISIALAKDGYNLAICARDESKLVQLSSDWRDQFKVEVAFLAVDLSIEKEVKEFAAFANTLGRIEVLVNNAGVFFPGSIHNEPSGQLETMINTNLYSAYHLTRDILPQMMKRQSGFIFNICSTASIYAYPNGGSYSISKFALLGFSKCLREEMKSKGIKVTSIIPGAVWTPSWQGAGLPESRFAQPSDVADVVVTSLHLSPNSIIEEIIVRPQLGDI
jgi:short-subunit dehydrogenase